MNPEQRRKRAAELASEINADPLLQDDLKFYLTHHTMDRITDTESFVRNHQRTPKTDFLR